MDNEQTGLDLETNIEDQNAFKLKVFNEESALLKQQLQDIQGQLNSFLESGDALVNSKSLPVKFVNRAKSGEIIKNLSELGRSILVHEKSLNEIAGAKSES